MFRLGPRLFVTIQWEPRWQRCGGGTLHKHFWVLMALVVAWCCRCCQWSMPCVGPSLLCKARKSFCKAGRVTSRCASSPQSLSGRPQMVQMAEEERRQLSSKARHTTMFFWMWCFFLIWVISQLKLLQTGTETLCKTNPPFTFLTPSQFARCTAHFTSGAAARRTCESTEVKFASYFCLSHCYGMWWFGMLLLVFQRNWSSCRLRTRRINADWNPKCGTYHNRHCSVVRSWSLN